jgi:hypothetical protein
VKQLRGWGGGGQVHGGCFTAVKQARPSGFSPCMRACVRACAHAVCCMTAGQ